MSHTTIAINIEMPKRRPTRAGMGHRSWVAGAVAGVGHDGAGTGTTESGTTASAWTEADAGNGEECRDGGRWQG
jgi:hypothetical protein